jgi:hypothetical protein
VVDDVGLFNFSVTNGNKDIFIQDANVRCLTG